MNWLPEQAHRFPQRARWLVLPAAVALLLWPALSARSDNFIFYFPNTHATLATKSFKNVQYLPLLPLLNLFGHVGELQSKKKSIKVWFGNAEMTLRENENTVRLNNTKVKLTSPIKTMDGEWMAPVDFLTTVLPGLINQTIEYQTGDDRVFIGGVKPNSFTLELEPLQAGARLTFQFTGQIKLQTAAQNGKWILYLGKHPVEPVESQFRFQNPYISGVQFDDSDGNPKLILTPSAAGLDFFPTLSQGDKVLVADIMKPGASVAERKPVAPPSPATPSSAANAAPGQASVPSTSPAGTPGGPAQAPGPALPVVVLDAGHGGADGGAQGKNGLLEKNLTAQIVTRVKNALLTTGKYQVILTRTGDAEVNFDERTIAANVAHPIAFISFHAGDMGPSTPHLIVYVYHPSSPLALAPGAQPQPLFVPWEKVQLGYLDRSRKLAQQLQQDLQKAPDLAGSGLMEAPVRILRSIAAPAITVEVGSLAPDTDPAPLTQQSFQDQIAAAVTQAVAEIPQGRS